MTPDEVKIQVKATALNKIRQIYHPKYKFPYSSGDWWDDESPSCAEQREKCVRDIIEQLERDLRKLKKK